MKVFIKEAARLKGYSLYKLAKFLELPQQTVYSWASGRTQPSFENMDKLCNVLECSLDVLFAPEPMDLPTTKELMEKEKQKLIDKFYKKLKKLEQAEIKSEPVKVYFPGQQT